MGPDQRGFSKFGFDLPSLRPPQLTNHSSPLDLIHYDWKNDMKHAFLITTRITN